MEKKALGKGLHALLPEKKKVNWSVGDEVKYLKADSIIPNRYQPRKVFDDDEIQNLCESIRAHGVLQPLIVRRTGDGAFELIAGERRLRAAKLAGLAAVPVLVKSSNDEKSLSLALIENIQRENLNIMEEARAYAQLIGEFRLTQEQVAEVMGKSRSSVTNVTRLMGLPSDVQQCLENGSLSFGHAKVLLGLNKKDDQSTYATLCVEKNLSVRELEDIVSKGNNETSLKPSTPAPSEFVHVEDRLRKHLGSKVEVKKRRKGGSLIIHFFSGEDLERIVGQVLNEPVP